ncbi:MAG: prepilin-type N-terminal cleavage/methylation domain-containing protein [Candidatus Manganitrophaceae bacterium]|nr:MAG: prepilin-type N-terminal cleavage/methylation domain-containing protein [Candidatus Manganitrophaceae bacterium]
MRGAKKNQRGFSLLEVVIAMSILSIGLLGVVGFFETGFKALRAGNRQGVAAQLAQSKMEELRSVHPMLLSDGQDEAEAMVRRWTIQRSVRDPRIWIVGVEVAWKSGLLPNQSVSIKSFVFH